MLQSILKELGAPNLLDILTDAPLHRLKPLLIHAFKHRSQMVTPTHLLEEYEQRQEFLGISSLSQDALYRFALICLEAVQPMFHAVQTSPIAPFALNAALSKISQNNTLSSIRGSEVVSDLTSQLALECALQRKRQARHADETSVHLSTAGRVLRLQPFDKSKGYMQHFNLFALCSGGVNRGENKGFAIPALQVHIDMLLRVLDALRLHGYNVSDIVVKISDIRFLDNLIDACSLPREEILRNSLNDNFDLFAQYKIAFPREVQYAHELDSPLFERNNLPVRTRYFAHIEETLIAPLRVKYPEVQFCFDFNRKSGLGYYQHLCFHIFGANQGSQIVQLADGGIVDWAAKLLGNKKEAMVISGIGAELVQKLFGDT